MEKKLLYVWIVILSLSVVLCGCSGKKTTGRTMQIPADGMIARTVFEQIKANDHIGVFNGNSNDITYQWLFVGGVIANPKDENLAVTFSDAKTDLVKKQLQAGYVQEFTFSTDGEVEGGPSLSVYFSVPWENADSAEIYRYDATSEKVDLISKAALENSPNAIVSFVPKEYGGLFYIVGTTGQSAAEASIQDSSTKATPKDKYQTDPIPTGKPAPVEPEDVKTDGNKKYTCTISIRCDTILDNMDKFNKNKVSVLPSDGMIMQTCTAVFYEGESVFDVLKRETRASRIHMEFSSVAAYNSAYIEGIGNVYEFDCGELSGWMYEVNGWFPNYGCSRYPLKDKDVVIWRYTCDLGRDIGGYVG